MLIVEDLFLLLTKDDGRPERPSGPAGFGYVAAAITDLILAGRVTLSDDKDPRVSVISTEPTDRPVLDAALERLARKDGKRLSSLLADQQVAPVAHVVDSLVRAGVVSVEEKRLMGLVPERRPVLDPGPEAHMRGRLRAALLGSEVTPHEATLLAILSGLEVAHVILREESGGMSKRDLKKRIETLATDSDASAVSAAVKRAVDAMNTAVVSAAIVPVITAGS